MIRFLETETKHGTNWHWFDVDGDEYAVVQGRDDSYLIDHNGIPVEPCNGDDGIFEQLLPLIP